MKKPRSYNNNSEGHLQKNYLAGKCVISRWLWALVHCSERISSPSLYSMWLMYSGRDAPLPPPQPLFLAEVERSRQKLFPPSKRGGRGGEEKPHSKTNFGPTTTSFAFGRGGGKGEDLIGHLACSSASGILLLLLSAPTQSRNFTSLEEKDATRWRGRRDFRSEGVYCGSGDYGGVPWRIKSVGALPRR